MTTAFTNAFEDQRCAQCGRPAPRSNYIILATARGYSSGYLCIAHYLCYVAAKAMQASTAARIVKGEKRRAWRKYRLDYMPEWWLEREQWLN